MNALANDCDNTDGWEAAAADVRDAAAIIGGLYGALEEAEAVMSTARLEINRLRKVAKLPEMEPAALNVAVYEARTALRKARGEHND